MGEGRNPLRTGIIGIVLVVSVVLVSFGYNKLPFWPQGKTYQAYFADAGGISPGNEVTVSGLKVGQVQGVALAGDVAKVTFTVDRKIRVGDQSLVSIKTDTILGEKSLAVTPGGRGDSTTIPLNRTTAPYTLNNALQDLGQTSSELDKQKFTQALGVLTDSLHDATPQLRQALDGVAALSRSINANDEALAQLLERAQIGHQDARRPSRSGEPAHRRRQPAVRGAGRTPGGDQHADLQHRAGLATDFGLRRRQPQGVRSGAAEAQRGPRQPAPAA